MQASPVGGSGAAHLYVFYASWWLWEIHLYVFYVSGRLWGGRRERSGSFVRVLRVLEALGGSFVRVLRVWEAPGGSDV